MSTGRKLQQASILGEDTAQPKLDKSARLYQRITHVAII
jgi:hypothetical protein